MASFKMALVLSAAIDLSVYGGYVNTAYLNAILTIPRYVKDNDGFPGKHKDHMCVVRKALYVLRQDGREWSDEFFKWMTAQIYQSAQRNHVYTNVMTRMEL